MIAIALRLIRDELGAYLEAVDGIPENEVVLGNIANLDEASAQLEEKIVVTNVIIEEESSLKNERHYQTSPASGIEYIEPPVYLNLYLLFSVTFKKESADGYEAALHKLSLIIQFFQSKKKFTVVNSPFSSISIAGGVSDTIKSELKLSMELYTVTFEQSNHLWSSLGGKQSPFVMYKVRLVKIQERITQEAPLIEEIQENAFST